MVEGRLLVWHSKGVRGVLLILSLTFFFIVITRTGAIALLLLVLGGLLLLLVIFFSFDLLLLDCFTILFRNFLVITVAVFVTGGARALTCFLLGSLAVNLCNILSICLLPLVRFAFLLDILDIIAFAV